MPMFWYTLCVMPLLGVIGAGDIGAYFPDTDAKWKGISSLLLLKEVVNMCRVKGFELANADSVIVAEKPKLTLASSGNEKNIASTLGVEIDQINIKATTTEKLGFAGREEGIAAYAVVLMVKNV